MASSFPLQLCIAGALLTAISILLAVAYGLGRRRAAGEHAKLAESVMTLSEESKRFAWEALNEKRKREEVVECIAIIEKERNAWKEMYYDTGMGHSAAQVMLMREIERLSLLCQRAGVPKSEVSPQVKRVVKEFDEKYVAPIRSEKSSGIAAGSGVEKPVAPV